MHLSISESSSLSSTSVTEKLTDIYQLLDRISEQKRMAAGEVSLIKAVLEEQNAIIHVLRTDNVKMTVGVSGLQPIHDQFSIYRKDAQETILGLELQLKDLRLKVNDLDKELLKLGVDVVQAETANADALMGVHARWEEKLNHMNKQSKRIIGEIVKKHCDVRKGYETVIHGLKDEIAHNEAKIAWGKLIIQERDTTIDKEMANLKKELEVTTSNNQELLKIRLASVERREHKMTKKCLRLQQDYEQKISNLKKEKDLQIKSLQHYSKLEAERDSAETGTVLEKAVRRLEDRCSKIIVDLQSASQIQRTKDAQRISKLECLLASRGSGDYKNYEI